MLDRFTSRFITSMFLGFFVLASSLRAQSLPAPATDTFTPDSQVTTTGEKPLPIPAQHELFSKDFAHQFLSDQKSIWSSPARVKKSDAKWLVPLAAGTAFLFTKDNQISHHFDNNVSLQNKSLRVSDMGNYAAFGVPGAFLALGSIKHSDRMLDTGKRGAEVGLYTTIAVQSLKLLTDRARPSQGGNGNFWNGGNSFPSGHSMEAWALAKVVADEYSDKPVIKYGMYAFATAVSLSRITAQQHFASDVLVGSSMGYLIGKFVMRNHHAESH